MGSLLELCAGVSSERFGEAAPTWLVNLGLRVLIVLPVFAVHVRMASGDGASEAAESFDSALLQLPCRFDASDCASGCEDILQAPSLLLSLYYGVRNAFPDDCDDSVRELIDGGGGTGGFVLGRGKVVCEAGVSGPEGFKAHFRGDDRLVIV